MASVELVEKLHTAAEDITRQLPEAHVLTRRYREKPFRAAAQRVVAILYEIDVQSLDDEQLATIERLTRVAQCAVEIHMTLRYTPDDVAECGYCADLINRFRDALDALDAGLPMDPERRPTTDGLLDELAANLARVG